MLAPPLAAAPWAEPAPPRRAVDALRGAVERLGTDVLAAGGAPDGGGAHSPSDGRALTDACLAIAYRVAVVRAAARRLPDLAAWSERLHPDASPTPATVAEAVRAGGPLGALGLAPDEVLPLLGAASAAAFLRTLPDDLDADALADAHQALLACEATLADGALCLRAPGRGRRAAGSFYTPPAVVAWLLDAALEPALDDTLRAAAARSQDPRAALLALRVCDPACGAGAFLVPAARRLRARLAALRGAPDLPGGEVPAGQVADGEVPGGEVPAGQVADGEVPGGQIADAKVADAKVADGKVADAKVADGKVADAKVADGGMLAGSVSADSVSDSVAVAACLHGVDLDPLALFVCRAALWLDALEADATPADREMLARTLAENILRGDARLGVEPEVLARGVPDLAFAANPGDDRSWLPRVRAANRAEREAPAPPLFATLPPGLPPSPIAARLAADAWCAAFFWPRTPDVAAPPTTATVAALAAGNRANLPDPDTTLATVRSLADRHGFLHWHLAFPQAHANGGFDVVLGNPPFLNQLERDTVASRPAAALLRARLGDLVGAYTDTAALLLLQGARLLRPGGRLGMVQPQSILAAKDARGIRAALATSAPPTHVWWAGEHVFPGIAVYVAGLALHRPPRAADAGPPQASPAEPRAPIRRAHGLGFAPLPALPGDAAILAGETWTPLVADALGAPVVHVRSAGRLGDLARATADFRDEYYGLVPFVVDRLDADEALFPRLVLTGHVDPARSWWGARAVRFGRASWAAPRVDLAALEADGALATWAAGRRVPKLLVATQTRVLEAVADPAGAWLTTTPTITVLPEPGALWRVAAVLVGPFASAWALANYGATALAAGAIKLSGKQVQALPLPTDLSAWNDAAALVAAAHAEPDAAASRARLVEAAALSVRAYEADATLLTWWRDRLPPLRGE